MRRLARYKFYIVDATDINNVFAYRKSFMTKELAKEAMDAYLSRDLELGIMTGSEVELHKIPLKRAGFRIHKPWVLRRGNVKDRINNYNKRQRINGTGINTHLFKRVWEPMPTDAKARTSFLLKDRDKIRNFILK